MGLQVQCALPFLVRAQGFEPPWLLEKLSPTSPRQELCSGSGPPTACGMEGAPGIVLCSGGAARLWVLTLQESPSDTVSGEDASFSTLNPKSSKFSYIHILGLLGRQNPKPDSCALCELGGRWGARAPSSGASGSFLVPFAGPLRGAGLPRGC